jgi:hypothetical protein
MRATRRKSDAYPSPIALQGRVFDKGRIRLDGRSDFLSKPHAGVLATLALEDVMLDYLSPMLERNNLVVRGGTLNTAGQIEYSPRIRRLELQTLTLRDLHAEYVSAAAAAAAEKRRLARVAETAKRIGEDPATDLCDKQVCGIISV